MTALQILPHVPLPGTPKRLDRVQLPLLHLSLLAPPHDRHALPAVDAELLDVVPVEVLDRLDAVRAPVELDLERLHRLLDRGADLVEPRVDPGLPHAHPRRLPHRVDQRVVPRVEMDGERGVNYPPVHLRAKVELHHVVVTQNGIVALVGGVVRGDVVEGASRGEGDAATLLAVGGLLEVEDRVREECARRVFEGFAEVDELGAGGEQRLDVGAHAAVHLGGLAGVVVDVQFNALFVTHLLGRRPVAVIIRVRKRRVLGKDPRWVKVLDRARNAPAPRVRGRRLPFFAPTRRLLLLLLALLLLLLLLPAVLRRSAVRGGLVVVVLAVAVGGRVVGGGGLLFGGLGGYLVIIRGGSHD
mmetsp:Transcript_18129/g.45832  ORF Transcript_18129/g.45832 Transcript_18129/m.45832 type:complete len:357 (+) Transcript_18129:424-1494(+)